MSPAPGGGGSHRVTGACALLETLFCLERLGHATASITLDICAHTLPGMQREALEKIDAALGLAMGK